MNVLQIQSILAGLFFGIWPICMHKSGLSGAVSSAAFSGMVFVCVLPFAFREFGGFAGIKVSMVIVAGVTAAIGVLCFNSMLAKATEQALGTLFITMILTQTAVPAVYQMIVEKGLSTNKGIGILLAAISAIMLNRR